MKNLKKVVTVCKNSDNYITIFYNMVYESANRFSYPVLHKHDALINIGQFSKHYPICHIPTMAEVKEIVKEKLKDCE